MQQLILQRLGRGAAVVALALVVIALPVPADATDVAADQPLDFTEADIDEAAVPPGLSDALDRSVQWRAVDLDVGALRAELVSPLVELELFDDAELALGSGTYSASAGDGYVWSSASGLDSLTLTIDGDEVRGSASIDGRSFQVAPVGDEHVIIEDGDIDADVGEPVPVPDDISGLPTAEVVAAARELVESGSAERPARTAVADGETTIRVLTVYTNDARTSYGGDVAAQADIAAIIDDANVVLTNSNVSVRLESAGIRHVPYDDALAIEDDLNALTFAETDALFDVHLDREVAEADIIMMVRGDTFTNTCGLAWLLDQPSSALDDEFAMGVIDKRCAPSPQFGYIHEVGHLLGAGHGNTPGDGVFAYSAGYRNTGATPAYRTIMAYEGDCNCGRVRYFSAPRTVTDATVGTVLIGSATQDNSRTLNETAHVVAAFRPFPLMPTLPGRLLDTRPDKKTIDGSNAGGGRRDATSVLTLQVAGRGEVPADAAAVMLNVTAVLPDEAGHITVWPCNETQPTASHLNYVADQVVPNSVLAKLDPQGQVCIYTRASMHLLADVTAYVPPGTTLQTLVPARYLDTRPDNETFDHQDEAAGTQAANTVLELQIAGRGAVPPGTDAVMLNVTAVLPQAAGHLTVWPCNAPQPTASSLNYGPGQVIANAVLAKLDDEGRVCIYTRATTHLLVDVNGAIAAGSRILTVPPARLLETRIGPNNRTVDGIAQGTGPLGADATDTLPFVMFDQGNYFGRGGVTPGAWAAIVNVTAVAPDRAGHITVWPCTDDIPTASNLNYVPGQVVANMAIAEFAYFDEFEGPCIYTVGQTDLLVDVVAYM